MRKIKLLFLLIGITLITTSFKESKTKAMSGDECDVANFYEAIDPDNGVKVLTSGGDLEEPELILVPTKIDEGTYEIEITRKGGNIYNLEGTKYYIETRYCYEYATYDDAILKVESNYGY
ncbi:hypothetical protein N8Y88_04240 [Saprospiraceae bacterium]|nr:hypothetical protein [Saprospiraceae bacterium]